MTTRSKRSPKKPKTELLAPKTVPSDPETSGYRGPQFISQRTAGVIVNEDTALTQSTVWACIRVISESLAGMPWKVGKLASDGTLDMLESHDLEWLLNFAPNDETQAFSFRETLWAWALGWGNGYAEIERDIVGNPVALWQLHPSRVRPMRDRFDRLVYEVQNDYEPPDYLSPRDMFHLKGPSPDGLVGWSVIRMHARTIGLAIAQENNAASFNENDSTPGGILSHPTKLTPEARENIVKSWNQMHQGPKNRRKIALLEEAMKWEQTGLPPQEAQLVEQMQLTPAMVCRIFRVPPHKVADLTRSTNNNIEHQDIEFVKDTLRPWAERGESEADVKLFGRNNQGKLVTVIDLSERERGDTTAQTQHVERMIFTGVYSVNEGRRYLGLKGIGTEGDKRYMQSAMVPLEDVGKDLAQPAQSSQSDAKMSRLEVGCMGIVTDACRRMLKRDNDSKNLTGDDFGQWLFKHREYCREILTPATLLLSECLGASGEASEVAVKLFLDRHFADGGGTPESKAEELRSYLLAAAAVKAA